MELRGGSERNQRGELSLLSRPTSEHSEGLPVSEHMENDLIIMSVTEQPTDEHLICSSNLESCALRQRFVLKEFPENVFHCKTSNVPLMNALQEVSTSWYKAFPEETYARVLKRRLLGLFTKGWGGGLWPLLLSAELPKDPKTITNRWTVAA